MANKFTNKPANLKMQVLNQFGPEMTVWKCVSKWQNVV